jgi:hypothetical protein
MTESAPCPHNPTEVPHRLPQSPICHKKKEGVYVFFPIQAPISAFHGLTKEVWPSHHTTSHHTTYGVRYPQDPIQLPHSTAQPPIHNPK